MTKIVQPIIIVGTGRCGSTVLHRLLAKHPQVMWLSGFSDRYPDRPSWNRRAVTAATSPLLGPIVGRRIQPSECYRFWDKHAYGFSEPCRDLLRSDVTPRVKRQVRGALEPMLTEKRNRLLLKITGWPRLGYLSEIFEDARFIHIVRNGCAVASSLLHVNFWRGWQGPQSWRAGLLTPEDEATWEHYNRSFAALAGLEWRIQMRAIEAARRTVDPERFYEVKYETFCQQPLETCRRILNFAELPSRPEFDREIQATAIRDMSNRWRDDLTPGQQNILTELLHADLVRYGYESSSRTEKLPQAVGR